jgi:DNA (cytosine-5)-methyltransferase 1
MGFHKAGFAVTGVDIDPQPDYPFDFRQGNAVTTDLSGFDAYIAGPPCQLHSRALNGRDHLRTKHADLIGALRHRLRRTGKPYVIENVPQAPLINPTMLCGSMFDLPIERHRLFEANFRIAPLACDHVRQWMLWPDGFPAYGETRQTPARVISIYGKGGGIKETQLWKWAMQIDWMESNHDLAEAIPPIYTQYIGVQLKAHLNREACKRSDPLTLQPSA